MALSDALRQSAGTPGWALTDPRATRQSAGTPGFSLQDNITATDPLQTEREFGNPFERGLGSAVRSMKGSMKDYVASALDAMGKKQAAKSWWASGKGDAERAATVAPDVQNLGQVSGLDTAAQYALGKMGEGLAYVPPALAGAAAARAGLGRAIGPELAAEAGGAAALHPVMAGGVARQLHDDPAAAGMSPQEQALRANAVGGLEGLIQAAVPGAMVNRLGARAPVAGIADAVKGAGREALTTAATGGAANAAADAVGQLHQMQYDPNKDFDTSQALEAGAGGAVGMLPVAGPHAVLSHGLDLAASGGRKALDTVSGAGDVAGKVSDSALRAASGPVESFRNYRDHPEMADIMTDQMMPPDVASGDDAGVLKWAASRDNAQREAALSMAQKIVADPNQPEAKRTASQELLSNPDNPDVWRPFVGALRMQENSRRVGANIREAAQEIGAKLPSMPTGADAEEVANKVGLNLRAAGQTVRDAVTGAVKKNLEPTQADGTYLDKITPHLEQAFGGKLSDDVSSAAASVLKDYVLGGFGQDEHGNVTVPKGLTAAFGDKTHEVISAAYDLLRRQGRTQDIDADAPKWLSAAKSEVDAQGPVHKSAADVVSQNLLPEHMDTLTTTDAKHISDGIRQYLSDGKTNKDVESQLDTWFGPNKDKVVEQIAKLHGRDNITAKDYAGGATIKAPVSDEAHAEQGVGKDEHAPTHDYHFADKSGKPFDANNDFVGEHMQRVAGNLDTSRYESRTDKATGKDYAQTEPVGIVDYARETGDGKALTKLYAEHADELKTLGDEGRDRMLNSRYKVLRSTEKMDNARDAGDVTEADLKQPTTVKGEPNKRAWSDVTSIGQKDVSTVEHGRVFLEQKDGDQFVTSARKLIGKMWEAKKKGAFAGETAEQTGGKDMLNMFSSGLASLLANDRFTGKMEVRMPDGSTRAVDKIEDFPKDFVLFNKHGGENVTVGDVQKAAGKETQAAIAEEGKIVKDEKGDHHIYATEAQARKAADKSKDQFVAPYQDRFAVFEKAGADGMSDKVKEGAGKGVSETEEMATQADKKAASTPRTFDELTGLELHPKEGGLEARKGRIDALRRDYNTANKRLQELVAQRKAQTGKNVPLDKRIEAAKAVVADLVAEGKKAVTGYKAGADKAEPKAAGPKKKLNAEPAAKKDVQDNPRFNMWFGDSKITNKDGSPQVMYHSTDASFDEFDPNRPGKNTNHASSGLGIFMTPDKETSAKYGQHQMALYARIENPYKMGVKEFSSFEDVAAAKKRQIELRDQGYDGIVVPMDGTTIAFSPYQLKSADKNVGTFGTLDPNIKRSGEAPGDATVKAASQEEIKAAQDHVTKTLGPKMQVEWKKAFPHGGSGEWENGVIRIATSALNPLSIAHHESMHELFQRLTDGKHDKAAKALLQAADSPLTVRRLERFFADKKFDDVRAAIKNDPEERLAYMYQLWASGQMKFGPETHGVFQKVTNFLRKVTGMLTNDQRAEAIMQAFHDGKMSEPSSMAKVIGDIDASGDTLRAIGKKMSPVFRGAKELIGTAESQLTGSANPALDKIGRMFNNKVGATDKDTGLLQAHVQANNQWLNKFADAMRPTEGVEQADINAALEGLQKGEKSNDPVIKKIQEGVRGVFDDMHDYLTKAGVSRFDEDTKKWEPIQKVKDYFARSWDTAKLNSDADKFTAALLEHHSKELNAIAAKANAEVGKGEDAGTYTASWERKNNSSTDHVTAEDVARAIHTRLVSTDGQQQLGEQTNSLGYSPMMKAVNRRTLDWIDMSKFSDYQRKDMVNILSNYVNQATKRAEYSRRFGPDGSVLETHLTDAWAHEIDKTAKEQYGVDDAVKQAKAMSKDPTQWQASLAKVLNTGTAKTKATEADAKAMIEGGLKALEPARRAIMAMEGTLGHDVSPLLRKASAYSTVYQNTRLLAYSMFSNLIDPLGIMVRGGEMKDAYAAFKRGMTGVTREWGDLTGLRPHKESDRDEATRIAEMIGTVDSGGFMSTMGNMYGSQFLPGWAKSWNDRFFRWNGMESFNKAMRVQATQAAIGFIKKHGDPMSENKHSERYLKELGLSREDVNLDSEGRLNVEDPNIQRAIMRWVDGAILRPNAAVRPSWMSDPHYSVFAHLKQFMYATHEILLKRVTHEIRNGNTDPLMLMMAAYVPTMLAADAAKGLLQTATGGGAPAWEHEGVAGILSHGVQRAGGLGIAQMGADAAQYGPTSLLGPMAEQLTSAFSHPVSESLKDAVAVGPLNILAKGAAMTNAVD